MCSLSGLSGIPTKMEKMVQYVPQSPLILAGLLAQLTYDRLVVYYKCGTPFVCQGDKCHFIWIPFVAFSSIVTLLVVHNTEPGHKAVRGALTFFGSLILNTSAPDATILTAVRCFGNVRAQTAFPHDYMGTVILVLAAVFVTVLFFLRPPEDDRPTPSIISHLPDAEVILTGVCLLRAYERYEISPWQDGKRCYGIPIELVTLSVILAGIQAAKSPGLQYKATRGILAFVLSFIVNLCCGYRGYEYITELRSETCNLLGGKSDKLYMAMSTTITSLGALFAAVIFSIRMILQTGHQKRLSLVLSAFNGKSKFEGRL